MFFSAPGEERECVEIARLILQETAHGVRFDQMAILLRDAKTYSSLLETALRRAAIPAYFARGTTRPDPSGRAFLALLACAGEGLSARRFAHIQPYAQNGPHSPNNGLLLRQDLHTLFDRGYMTVTPEHRLKVSTRIREEFDNGREYYAMHGSTIRAPAREQYQPSRDYLAWHNDYVFRQ